MRGAHRVGRQIAVGAFDVTGRDVNRKPAREELLNIQ
jgi:hypothetical protein